MDWLTNLVGPDWARAVAQFVGINVGFVLVLMIVAYTVLAERRVLGFIQGRLGPNRVGPGGMFQPFADLLKFIMKEEITPSASTRFVYFLAPIIAITAALMPIIVYPFGPEVSLPFIGRFHLVLELEVQPDGRPARVGADDLLRTVFGPVARRGGAHLGDARPLLGRRAAGRLVRPQVEHLGRLARAA